MDTERLLDLAQLSIEPLHREDEAIVLVEFVLRFEPDNPRARILFAYLALHYLIVDEQVRRAEGLLRDLVERRVELGAAASLLDDVRERIAPTGPEGDVELLRLSVEAEPSWSDNHHRLGRALYTRGDPVGAWREYDAAIGNLVDRASPMDPLVVSFHDCFTGCTSTRERLIADRDKLFSY